MARTKQTLRPKQESNANKEVAPQKRKLEIDENPRPQKKFLNSWDCSVCKQEYCEFELNLLNWKPTSCLCNIICYKCISKAKKVRKIKEAIAMVNNHPHIYEYLEEVFKYDARIFLDAHQKCRFIGKDILQICGNIDQFRTAIRNNHNVSIRDHPLALFYGYRQLVTIPAINKLKYKLDYESIGNDFCVFYDFDLKIKFQKK